MSDILREVDDDMRRQQLQAFWAENRLWILGGIILAIVATGSVTFWRGYMRQENMQATAQLMTALETPDTLAKLGDDPAALDSAAHAALARLAAADRHLKAGEKDKALALFDALAADRRAPDALRDLGRLYAAGQRLDTAPADQLEKDLSALTRANAPWRFTALEYLALLYAREGRMKDAAEKLAQISGDPMAPQDARTRAFTLHELYSADAAAAAPARTK